MKDQYVLRAGVLAAAIAIGLGCTSASAAEPRLAGPLHIPAESAHAGGQRFIVKFKPGLMRQGGGSAQATLSAAVARAWPARGAGAVPQLKSERRTAMGSDVVLASRPLDAAESDRLLHALRQDPAVAYAQIDHRMYPLGNMPNDPQLQVLQWDMLDTIGGIHAPKAWQESTGEGVVVAVLDTGIVPHLDLAANLVPGYDMIASFGQDDDNPDVAVDGDGRDPDPTDPGDWSDGTLCGAYSSSWHGTHVAGTVSAVANNGRGIAGASHGARVQPVRVLGRCGGFTSDIVDGIVWAAGGQVEGVPDNETPAEVINLSLGGGRSCAQVPELQAAVDAAREMGVVVVAAAGNSNMDTAGFAPASCKGVIAVAAVGMGGTKAGYSNYGTTVTLSAPGGDIDRSLPPSMGAIWSTGDGGETAANGDNLLLGMQGTSMAAPHVAAVAALVQSAAVKAGHGPLVPDQVRDILVQSVRPFPAPPPAGKPMGAGLLDAHRAVQLALGNELPELPKLMLESGVRLREQSGVAGQSIVYVLDVPPGARTLNLRTMGGTGNVSLYASHREDATPETAEHRSSKPGPAEAIVISRPVSGRWYVHVVGETGFRNVSVLGLAR